MASLKTVRTVGTADLTCKTSIIDNLPALAAAFKWHQIPAVALFS
jgi:hypothetical protein